MYCHARVPGEPPSVSAWRVGGRLAAAWLPADFWTAFNKELCRRRVGELHGLGRSAHSWIHGCMHRAASGCRERWGRICGPA